MNKQIECYYQQNIKRFTGFDSEYFPHGLERLEGVQRLKIHAPQGEFESLFEQINLKTSWIVFSSQSAENFKVCNLSWLQRWKLIGLCDHGSLFYISSKSLGAIKDVSESLLWRYGAGIALPVKEPNEFDIGKAIDTQIGIKKNLIEAIEIKYKCAILANRDGYGVDVIWNKNWEFASEITDWAIGLADEYKWGGYPFLEVKP